MYKCKYPHLFSPITLGNVVFRNRIFAAPTGLFFGDVNHRPVNENMRFYERKAKGGAASVCVGDAMVDKEHMHGSYSLSLDTPDIMPAMNRLSGLISRHGAVAAIEFFHPGSAANTAPGVRPFGPQDGIVVKYAAEVKKHVKISKLATISALSDPELLEKIITGGNADVVELARGIICDPDLPNKAREGREDEIVHCMRCLTCFSNLIRHGQIVCALNTEIENASEHICAMPASSPKKVLVVGGGVAGMEAAITCADRGHEVVLCEKSGKLGGVLRCEDDVPFKKHLKGYLDLQERNIKKRGIRVMTDTEVTREFAERMAPDAIIAATGSRPLIPDIPGIERAVLAKDVYLCPDKAGRKTVILGGGLVGAELAIYLGGLGREVTLIEMLPSVNVGDNMLHGMAIGIELGRLGIKLAFGTRIVEINDKGVVGRNADGRVFFEADTAVNALGMLPGSDAAEKLRFCAPIFHMIGDCLAVKNIYEATRTAHQIALDIG